MIENKNYISFKIIEKEHNKCGDFFEFTKNELCQVSDDRFIAEIEVAADISSVTFYLHDSLAITNETLSTIIDYLHTFLSNLVISVFKNSLYYSSAMLKPTIHLLSTHFSNNTNLDMGFREHVQVRDTISIKKVLRNGNEVLNCWIQDVELAHYASKPDRYDILFSLLQGENIAQKYIGIYAYLVSLVREIYRLEYEGQKHVVRYITANCSRVGITIRLSPSTRPFAKSTDKDDQFTTLRNQIAHPLVRIKPVTVSEIEVNQLISIVCCAIEDIPS